MTIEVSEDFALFNNAAENNKRHILEHLKRLLRDPVDMLEIGSGSGQHVVYFAQALPHVRWLPGDRAEYFDALGVNLAKVALPNIAPPRYLDVVDFPRDIQCDITYCANVLHIMAADLMPSLFEGVAATGSRMLILYGPYKYNGKFTTESNANFDSWLRSRDSASGIRDIEDVTALAGEYNFRLVEDNAMPANNQLLVFTRA
jgi:hypothetical protein